MALQYIKHKGTMFKNRTLIWEIIIVEKIIPIQYNIKTIKVTYYKFKN